MKRFLIHWGLWFFGMIGVMGLFVGIIGLALTLPPELQPLAPLSLLLLVGSFLAALGTAAR